MIIGHGQSIPQSQHLHRSRLEVAVPRTLFRRLRAQTKRRGELRLALAVLEDAVRCLERNQGTRRFRPLLLRWEAEQWIASRSRDTLFSFENVCAALCLKAEALRGQIITWHQRRRHRSTRPSSGVSTRTAVLSRFPISHFAVPEASPWSCGIRIRGWRREA